MRFTLATAVFILTAWSLTVAPGFAQAPDAPPPPGMMAPAGAQAADNDIALVDGKMTLRLPQGFADQSRRDANAQQTGVAVHLYVSRLHAQVVGISEIKTAAGDANDTSDAAFDKMAQGALSGLKTQFSDVRQTGRTVTMAGGRKFLRIDSDQTMKGESMAGTTLVTPFAGHVITLQVLTPKADVKSHARLVDDILASIAFH
ncbi:hypothetical protein [Martelella alba]|uniref:Uncharacterized protein n=1 Tax=Martelella alba TaxID=2590451 RepID=A0ABY2SSR4_9HYPH|nr:hypothetical protein [Martelella alba]TKI07262.1 hypothetical protein FCN80_07520 [Martelella alba]